MRQQWQQLTARFDARPLRERLIVLAAVVLGTGSLYQTFAVDPIVAREQRLTQQLEQTRTQVRELQSVMFSASAVVDPDATKRTYRDALRDQIAEIDRNMAGLQKALVPPEQMTRLLQDMLATQRGLTLVSLKKLPVRRFDAAAGEVAADGAKAGSLPAASERMVYQHGFEISVQGSYADLHDYLVRLETLPWQMFWGRAVLDAAQHPVITLTLTVHTLSLNPAWLTV